MFTKAIVRPPAPNFSEGLTTADLGAPQFARAIEQHAAYSAALEQCGLTVIRLESEPNYPDSTFVEDTAILAERSTEASTSFAVITRPGAPSRRGEVTSVRRVIADFYPELFSIRAPGTVDGGDVCQAGDHFFIGMSERTNEAGSRQLTDLLALLGYSSSIVDIRPIGGLLHLKSGLAYLGDNRLVVTETLGHVEFPDYELIWVSPTESYAANCIRVNEHVLVPAGYSEFADTLRELGYKTIEVEMSEFQKMDGGLSCLSLRF
jgi:dimethylargininase